MSEPASSVAVALIYESRGQGEHVRETLAELGTSIVYEADTGAFDRNALDQSNASVVVINLDGEDDPAVDAARLDAVYGLLDDVRYRVVFNDGEVSSALTGWDQARWMRHLAAKVFGADDIDPPRPAGAESVPVVQAVQGVSRAQSARSDDGVGSVPGVMRAETDPMPFADEDSADQVTPNRANGTEAEEAGSEALIDLNEIATLLDYPDAERAAPQLASDEMGSSLLPPPADVADAALDLAELQGLIGDMEDTAAPDGVSADTAPPPGDHDLGFDLVEMESAPTDGELDTPAQSVAESELPIDFDLKLDDAPDPSQAEPEPATLAQIPADWSLEDLLDDPDAAPAPPPTGPAVFGIETMSPQEFLAPTRTVDQEPTFPALEDVSFELMPLDEAVAPTQLESLDHENWLDPENVPKAKVTRVWVLGASIGGPESVREFLGEIPRDFPALFLLAQHLGDEFVDMMTQQLARTTELTVRTPSHGERVGHGEVVVVPTSHRLLVDAQGVVVLERIAGDAAYRPSIDRVIEDIADRFGANAGAIIFSGMSDDAVKGCIHLADKGGRIYAQRPDTCVVSSMIDSVVETGLVEFLGAPGELAAKLLEERA